MSSTPTTNADQVLSSRLVSGGLYVADLTAAAPDDASTPLPSEYKSLGLVSDAGIKRSTASKQQEWRDSSGSLVRVITTESTTTFLLSLLETSVATLSEVYGAENVTVEGDKIKVAITAQVRAPRSWAFESVDGDLGQIREYFIGAVSESAKDLTFDSTNPHEHTITITARVLPDGSNSLRFYELASLAGA